MSLLAIILAIGGMFWGAILYDLEGFILGGSLGYLLGAVITLGKRVNALSEELVRVSKEATPIEPTAVKTPVAPQTVARQTSPARTETPPLVAAKKPASVPTPVPPQTTVVRTAAEDKIYQYIKSFFTEGNVILKVGLIVLFFGVAFLLKYAADQDMLPIELRLLGVVAGALVLLWLGWRLRLRRTMYGLLLQGGAIGILYITVFSAAKLYGLIPLGLAFGIMLGLVGFSAALSILQNALWLVVFGTMGGFLAPVLTSSGDGNYIMLFSYYAVLNLGIFAIAWYRTWRILNVLGFVFTLGISTAWGVNSYQPAFFMTTEPFLIFFFLLFTTIAVLYAFRQPPELKGLVDGSLVFGVPVAAFSLQTALVSEFEYGLALSALALGIFYITLAMSLWRRQANKMRVLTESFLALGVVFGSLAIPLALDGTWTRLPGRWKGRPLSGLVFDKGVCWHGSLVCSCRPEPV